MYASKKGCEKKHHYRMLKDICAKQWHQSLTLKCIRLHQNLIRGMLGLFCVLHLPLVDKIYIKKHT